MPDYTIKCSRCQSDVTHVCNPTLRDTAIRLYSWRPEIGFPQQMKSRNLYLPDREEKRRVDSPTIPFMSEAYLYALLGKDDARTLLALVNSLLRESGIDPEAIRDVAGARLDEEEKERKAREERSRLLAERRRKANGDV